MLRSKHIDKICIFVMGIVIFVTVMMMKNYKPENVLAGKTMKYENTIFDTAYVHRIDIVMDDWDSFIENCESEEYSACSVVIDGRSYNNIAIRAKGNTSLSNVRSLGSSRYSFKLEFDHYEYGQNYDGLDKLCLNNLIQDNTMMKDYLAYTMMKDFGVNSPLTSYAYITVNGEDWGLYLAVEAVEDSFLARNYGNETGELYKPDSTGFGGGRGYGRDFNMEDIEFGKSVSIDNIDGNNNGGNIPVAGKRNVIEEANGDNINQNNAKMPFPDNEWESMPGNPGGGRGSDDVKLKYTDDNPESYTNIFENAKTNITKEDQKRLIEALKNLGEYVNLENTLDTDRVMRYFVVHNFLCNGDSYTGDMIHNYYLHERNGQMDMIPWDYNLAMGAFQGRSAEATVNESINEVLSDRPMQAWIFSEEAYTRQYYELYREFIGKWFGDSRLESLIEETEGLIYKYVEADPTKFCQLEEFEKGVETLKSFVTLRAQAVSLQLDGDTTPVEAGNMNLNEMGSMGMGKNREPGQQQGNKQIGRRAGAEAIEAAKTTEVTESAPSGQQRNEEIQQPNEGQQLDIPGMQQSKERVQDKGTWIAIGISLVVLLFGLWIAVIIYKK